MPSWNPFSTVPSVLALIWYNYSCQLCLGEKARFDSTWKTSVQLYNFKFTLRTEGRNLRK